MPPMLKPPTPACGCARTRGMTASQTYSAPSQGAPASSPSPAPAGNMAQLSAGRPAAPSQTQAARPGASAQVSPPVCYATVDGVVIAVDCRLVQR